MLRRVAVNAEPRLAVFLAAKESEGEGRKSCRDTLAEKRWAFMVEKRGNTAVTACAIRRR